VGRGGGITILVVPATGGNRRRENQRFDRNSRVKKQAEASAVGRKPSSPFLKVGLSHESLKLPGKSEAAGNKTQKYLEVNQRPRGEVNGSAAKKKESRGWGSSTPAPNHPNARGLGKEGASRRVRTACSRSEKGNLKDLRVGRAPETQNAYIGTSSRKKQGKKNESEGLGAD